MKKTPEHDIELYNLTLFTPCQYFFLARHIPDLYGDMLLTLSD